MAKRGADFDNDFDDELKKMCTETKCDICVVPISGKEQGKAADEESREPQEHQEGVGIAHQYHSGVQFIIQIFNRILINNKILSNLLGVTESINNFHSDHIQRSRILFRIPF